eukprot:JZ552064.1.p2 GENE.JZ552064.1~~JZ552064.1.p2  ORF type:complete len:94 (+),score=7.36 JZ552064.1:155-436(+)
MAVPSSAFELVMARRAGVNGAGGDAGSGAGAGARGPLGLPLFTTVGWTGDVLDGSGRTLLPMSNPVAGMGQEAPRLGSPAPTLGGSVEEDFHI